MRRFALPLIVVATALTVTFAGPAAAATRLIKNVRVSVGGQKQYFNLFQSPVEPSLWYCGQTKPAVIIRKAEDLDIPEISIIRFQKKDAKNSQKLVEGAYFRMNLSLGPAEDVFEVLKKQIPSSARQRPVVLSPVPFGALRLFLHKPDGQKIKLAAEPLSGISKRHSSQNVSFSTLLGPLETDLLDALLRGNTGAKYSLDYNYQYLDPVLTGKSLVDNLEERDAKDPRSSESGGGRELPGARDFENLEREAAQETGWQTAGEGFIGFAGYSEKVREKCIFIENDLEGWNNAYLTLPAVCMPAGVDIKKVELEVTIVHDRKSFENKVFTWTPARSWRDKFGAPLVYGVFDLTAIRKKTPKFLSEAKFLVKQRIESGISEVLLAETSFDLIRGDTPVSDPLDLADVLEVETGLLTWAANGKDGLKRIEVSLKQADWNSERVLEGPGMQRWLIKRIKEGDSAPLLAEINFIVTSGRSEQKIPWSLNGQDLRGRLAALSIILFDKDWAKK